MIIKMKSSIKELRHICKKPYWGFLQERCHRISIYITWLLVCTPITPNQVTIFWVLIQLLSPFLLITGKYSYMLTGILLFHFAFILDCVDGQLARYKKIYSVKGMYIDKLGHHISIPLLLVCLSIGVFEIYNNILYLIFGALALFSFLYTKLFIYGIPEQAQIKLKKLKKDFSFKNKKRRVRTFLFELIRIEEPLNILFWCILLGYPNYALIIYSVLFFFGMLRTLVKTFISLKKIDKKEI